MTHLLAVVLMAWLQPAPAPLETVARDSMSGIEDSRQAVARSEQEWARLWREHAGARPVPRVDFTVKMVLAVFLGTRPSAGYDVEITGTRAEGTGLVVSWRERQPSRDAITAQVLTSPAHVVAVPKVSGAVRFEQAGQ